MLATIVSIPVVILLIGSFLPLVIIYVSFKSFNYWESRNVFTLAPSILFGNTMDVFRQRKLPGFDLLKLYNSVKSQSKKYGGYYLFFKPVFVPTDLNLIKKILISDFNHFSDRVSHVDDQIDPLSANLLFLNGDRWKKVRQVLRSSFSSKKAREGMPQLQQCTHNLMEVVENIMEEGNCLDVKSVFDKYNIDVIGSLIAGVNYNTLRGENPKLEKCLKSILTTSLVGFLARFVLSFPKIKDFIKLPVFNADCTSFFLNFTKEQRTLSKGIIHALNTSVVPFQDYEVAANLAILFLTGYDTSSNIASFCLYELALNHKLQEAARQEVIAVSDKHGGTLTHDALADLELLGRCIKETLRKYPLATELSRVCIEPYAVPDSTVILEKGCQVFIPMRAIHWDPEYYPDPEVFNPDRFTNEKIRNRHPCAWIPFSTGPRHCIGSKVANISMKLSMANLLKNYRFFVHPSTRHPLEYDPNAYILQAKYGIKLTVIKI